MGKHSKCCNPFNRRHKKAQHQSATPIANLQRCRDAFPDFGWEAGQELCLRCRLDILMHIQRLQENVEVPARSPQRPDPANIDDNENESRILPENNSNEPDGSSTLPSAPAACSIYPLLPVPASLETPEVDSRNDTANSTATRPSAEQEVSTAGSATRIYPQLPEKPCSSRQALGKI